MSEATYDLSTPVGQVRFEIPDTDLRKPMFTDAEIQYLLTSNDGNIHLAAAHALYIITGDPNRAIQWSRGSVSSVRNLAETIQKRINHLRSTAEAFSTIPVERADWP